MNNNKGPFGPFGDLTRMGEQFSNMFGDDFFKGWMNQMAAPVWTGPGTRKGGKRMTAQDNGQAAQSPMTGVLPDWMSQFGAHNPFSAWFNQGAPGGSSGVGPWYDDFPPVDVYQSDREIILVMEVPGVERPSDLRLSVFPDRVVVKGEIPTRYNIRQTGNRAVGERRVGSFERSILLPVRVRKEGVKAVVRAGLLEVRLRKEAGTSSNDGSFVRVEFE